VTERSEVSIRKSSADPGARRRLHPLTPLLKGAKTLAVTVAAVSWSGYDQLGFARWLVLVFAVVVLNLVLAGVSWLVTGFQVAGRELRIYEGLIWRRTRTIPLERVQAIDVNRPLLARLTGVAELRLEVIGASKAEAPLAYLSVAEAGDLRRRLLAVVRGVGPQPEKEAAAEPADATAVAPDEVPIHVVDNRYVLIANLLTPPVLFVPIALALTITPMALDPPTWSTIGVASAVTALFGVVLSPLRRIFSQWNFRIGVDSTGLRLRSGLFETRSQTVPPLRVQAVQVTQPLLWRRLGWVRAKLSVAGYGGGDGQHGVRGSVLLPVADWPTARAVIARVLDGVDIEALPLRPVPARARLVTPLAFRRRAFGYTDEVVAARDGWLTVRLVVAKLARLQSVRVVQGPVQRRIRLADLHVDTAGSLHTVGRDRDAAGAYGLAEDLADLSRAARAAEAARLADGFPAEAEADADAPAALEASAAESGSAARAASMAGGTAGGAEAADLPRHQRSPSEQSPNANPTYTQPTSTSIT
jgi:putative membrane protein